MKLRITVSYSCLGIILFLLSACGGGSSSGTPAPPPPVPERITFSDTGIIGIFDPSVAKDPVSGRLWMSYSNVDPSSYFPVAPEFGVGIRLAYSDDGGVTWTDAGVVVVSYAEAQVGPLPTINLGTIPSGTNAIWMSETSTLVYDPGAPASERWKIIWHQYLKADGVSYFVDYSWIALKMAATPSDLATATPIKLFAGYGLQPASQITTAPAFSPIGGPQAIQLNTGLNPATSPADVTELDTCAFGEPGLLATATAFYVSMVCGHLGPTIDTYIVLFKCSSPCNVTDGNSWTYLGRLTTPADAANIGRDKHGAPQLLERAGSFYLIATPIEVVGMDDRYDGCRVYQFVDIDTGSLKRTAGVLDEVQRVDGVANTHNGACTDHADLQEGILYSQFDDTDPPELFRIFQSFKKIP